MAIGSGVWQLFLLLACVQLLLISVRAEDSAAFSKASNESLLWGPYKPNLYFGVRPRLPKSISTGLLWARVEDYATVQQSELIQVCLEQLNAAN